MKRNEERFGHTVGSYHDIYFGNARKRELKLLLFFC